MNDVCPTCNSNDIEGQGFEGEGEVAWQNVECNECGSKWQEVYVFDYIDQIRR